MTRIRYEYKQNTEHGQKMIDLRPRDQNAWDRDRYFIRLRPTVVRPGPIPKKSCGDHAGLVTLTSLAHSKSPLHGSGTVCHCRSDYTVSLTITFGQQLNTLSQWVVSTHCILAQY